MAAKPRFDGEWVHVSDAFDLRMGKTPSRKNPAFWSDGTHDWVSIGDLGTFGKYVGRTKEQINELAIEKSGIKPSPENTVLMSFKLSLGKASITTRPTYTNEAIMAFVDKGVYPVDSSFLYHQCRAKDWTAGTNTAVMGKTLNKKTLGQATVFLPEISMQKEIAARLDFVESLISDARGQLSKLDALVKSRFVEMFGDVCEGIGRYEFRPIGELCVRIVGGGTPSMKHPEYYEGGTIPWLKSGDVKARVVASGSIDITEEGLANSSARMVPEGSVIVVTRSGILKHSLPVAKAARSLAINQDLKALIPDERVLPDYLQWSLISATPFLLSKVRATTADNIETSLLRNFRIPVPPLSAQQEFAAFAAQVDKSRFIVQQQIEKLQTLYGSLAQEYFS